MVVFTNGRLLVSPTPNLEAMQELIEEMTERAREQIGNQKIVFKQLTDPFDCYENTNKLSYQQLKDAMPEYVDLQFKAIGRESVTLPGTKMKDIKHIFTPEEKEAIAEDICELQNDKERLVNEKKDVMKSYSQQIESKETALSDECKKHRQGYEWQSKECLITLDFVEKKKHFTDKITGTLLHTEDLTPDDQRSLWDIDGFVPGDEVNDETDEASEPDLENEEEKQTPLD